MRALLVPFASLCVLLLSSAAVARTESFQAVSDPCIKALMENGIESVGGINLTKLLKDFKRVKEVHLLNEVPIGSCGRRLGALNLPGSDTIVIPPDYYGKLSSRVKQVWLRHEKMGASGHTYDVNYASSVGIEWLGGLPKNEQKWIAASGILNQVTRAHPVEAPCSNALAEGGSTGVGGGGDPDAIQIKLDLLDFARTTMKGWSHRDLGYLYKEILNLPVEIIYPNFHFPPKDPAHPVDPNVLLQYYTDFLRKPVKFDHIQGQPVAYVRGFAYNKFAQKYKDDILRPLFVKTLYESEMTEIKVLTAKARAHEKKR